MFFTLHTNNTFRPFVNYSIDEIRQLTCLNGSKKKAVCSDGTVIKLNGGMKILFTDNTEINTEGELYLTFESFTDEEVLDRKYIVELCSLQDRETTYIPLSSIHSIKSLANFRGTEFSLYCTLKDRTFVFNLDLVRFLNKEEVPQVTNLK